MHLPSYLLSLVHVANFDFDEPRSKLLLVQQTKGFLLITQTKLFLGYHHLAYKFLSALVID